MNVICWCLSLPVSHSLEAVLKAIISKQNYLAVKKLIYFSLTTPFLFMETSKELQ